MIILEEKDGRERPPLKPEYDSEELMTELLDAVVEVYMKLQEIKATALELSLSPNKVKKLLITAGVINYPETEQIQRLLESGKSMEEVQETMRLSRAAINTYLPYSKCVYKMFFASTFWTKLQNIFGHCCKTFLDIVACPNWTKLQCYRLAV